MTFINIFCKINILICFIKKIGFFEFMEIFIEFLSDDLILIVIDGEFTIAETNVFDTLVLPVFERSENNIVIDMANLSFIDSFGIGKLFSMLNMAKLKGKQLYLMNISDEIHKLFDTVKLLRYYSVIEPSELDSKFGIKRS